MKECPVGYKEVVCRYITKKGKRPIYPKKTLGSFISSSRLTPRRRSKK